MQSSGYANYAVRHLRFRYSILSLFLWIGFLVTLNTAPSFALDYAVLHIFPAPGSNSAAAAINNAGEVTGSYLPDGTIPGIAFLFADGAVTPISAAQSGVSININREIFLYSWPQAAVYSIYSNGTITPAPYLSFVNYTTGPNILNDAGQIVASTVTYQGTNQFGDGVTVTAPCRIEPDGTITYLVNDIGASAVSNTAWTNAINGRGWVTGMTTFFGDDNEDAFVYQNGRTINLQRGHGMSVSMSGDVAGFSDIYFDASRTPIGPPTLWRASGMRIDLNPDDSSIVCLNNAGEVLYCDGNFTPYVCRYQQPSIPVINLYSAIPPNPAFIPFPWMPSAINDAGQIAGTDNYGAFIATPYFLQNGENTSDVPLSYGSGGPSGATGSFGCALCCAANMARSLIALSPSHFPIRYITPATMNADLVRLGAFTRTNAISDWSKIAAALSGDAPVSFVGTVSANKLNLNALLTSCIYGRGQRVILKLNETRTYPDDTSQSGIHFVWVIGQQGNDWVVADPGWSTTTDGGGSAELTSLNAHYAGFQTASAKYGSVMRQFTPSAIYIFQNNGYTVPVAAPANSSLARTSRSLAAGAQDTIASLSVTVTGTAEILITDPQGRKVGYDPSSGQYFSSIPNSSYDQNPPIMPTDDSDVGDPSTGSATAFVGSPEPGIYTISVVGTGAGIATVQSSLSGMGGSVQNTATTADATAGVNTTTQLSVPDQNVADVTISQSANVDPPQVGRNLVYMLTVVNNGPACATAVQVVDAIPQGVNFIGLTSSQGECDTSHLPSITCNLGTLPVGATASVAITVAPTAVAPLVNAASIEAFETDPDLSNNASVLTSQIGVMNFQGWGQVYFSQAQSGDPSVSGPLADPSGDGGANLLKYALGGTPSTPYASLAPQLKSVYDFNTPSNQYGPYLALAFSEIPSATDISYNIEASVDLVNWAAIDGVVMSSSNNLNGTRSIVIRDVVPSPGVSQRFLRLRIIKN